MNEDKDSVERVEEDAVTEDAQEDIELKDEVAEKIAGGRKAGGDPTSSGKPF
jgi:hypothetical protein